MFITRADLKGEAKKRLATHKKPSRIATLVSVLLPGIVFPSGIAPLFLDGPFAAGLAQFFLKLVRGEEPGVGTVFQGFAKFLRNIRVWLLQVVFAALWSLLLVVPGVIAALRYSMVWFVLVDEPDLKAREAIQRSKTLTKGRLRDLFGIWVSFLPWIGFGIITIGIGFLFVVPYIQSTLALFYEGLKQVEEKPSRPELT